MSHGRVVLMGLPSKQSSYTIHNRSEKGLIVNITYGRGHNNIERVVAKIAPYWIARVEDFNFILANPGHGHSNSYCPRI